MANLRQGSPIDSHSFFLSVSAHEQCQARRYARLNTAVMNTLWDIVYVDMDKYYLDYILLMCQPTSQPEVLI